MMPKSLSLTVIYEGTVADVAGVTKEPVIVSEGFVFVELLREIFLHILKLNNGSLRAV